MVGDRKVAGVLTELVAHTGWTVVGIGLNVNTDHTTNDLPATATSLAQESARWIARGALLRAILERIDFHLGAITSYGEEHVRARWEALLWRRHQRVQVDDEGKVVEGTVLGLSATGALRLRSANGRLLEIVIGDVWLVP
jgi:BirA family biotin operon repressor/biotin-[acetyl-CoA-carboxylase] ligase